MQPAAPNTTTNTTPTSNEQYHVLDTPQSIIFDIEGYTNHGTLDLTHIYHTLYLGCNTLKSTPFPLNSNPRQPNSFGSNPDRDVVLSMKKTLAERPCDFVKFNNGLTVVCSGIILLDAEGEETEDPEEVSKVKITFGDGEGILNGGHTYFAIQSSPRIHEDSRVRIELIELNEEFQGESEEAIELKKKEILKIAMNRNKNRVLKSHTQMNFEGKYDIFKEHLGQCRDENISWTKNVDWAEGHETNEGSIKAKDFIRFLATLDPFWYHHPLEKTNPDHITACTGDVHESTWKSATNEPDSQYNLAHMAPLSRATIYLHEHIRADLLHGNRYGALRRTNFFEWATARKSKVDSLIFANDDGPIKVHKSKPIFLAFILGMLRRTVWWGFDENDEIAFVGFVSDPVKIFNQIRAELYQAIEQPFTSTFGGKDGRRLVGDRVFHKHFRDLIDEKVELDYHFPESFYSFDDEKWYFASNDDANILLIKAEDTYSTDATNLEESDNAKLYKSGQPPY